MKKLIVILSISFLSADVKWVNSYEEALKANKPIFIYIAQKKCGACRYMDNTLKDKKIYNYLNRYFVSLKKYVNDDRVYIPNNLNSSLTPTLHLLDTNGDKLIKSFSGGKNVVGFYRMLTKAIDNKK